jgi:triosephosphate isomerase (TIM)
MRVPLLVANWKMNLGPEEGLTVFREVRRRVAAFRSVQIVICSPFITLPSLAAARPRAGAGVALGAQDCHWATHGAYTGDISAGMLRGLCEWVLIGHSERREGHGETDALIHKKLHRALEVGLRPVLCVGESEAAREAGETARVIRQQVIEGLGDLPPSLVHEQVTIAYEPVWAIGSGKAASPAEANRVAGLLVRGALADHYGESLASATRVLYGGSVSPSNISDFLIQPEVDGALVGGASLDPSQFVALVETAHHLAGKQHYPRD